MEYSPSPEALRKARAGFLCKVTTGIVAALWVLAFHVYFFSLNLPNNQNLPRTEVLSLTPDLLLQLVSPREQPDAKVGWRYLPQRMELAWGSALILLGAWSVGSLALRGLKLRRRLQPLEFFVFACGAGLAITSLIILICGLFGYLSRPLHLTWILAASLVELILLLRDRQIRGQADLTEKIEVGPHPKRRFRRRSLWPVLTLLASLPFLFCIVFGGLLPQVDFDVKEYHFGGPKEWFQQGRISWLPHNVYTSFPFLTEMLILAGMIIKQDWFWGAVTGNGVLLCFAPLTSLGLYAAGRRWYGDGAGLLAAWLYLCTPWVFRISNIAYTEGGLSFYLFAALFAGLLAIDRRQEASEAPLERGAALRLALVAGFLAGSAMACKYPGVLSVVIPIGSLILFGRSEQEKYSTSPEGEDSPPRLLSISILRPNIKAAFIFTLGVAFAIGPWLIKNAVQTGNPVYPLLYRTFGGLDWDDELDAKWKRAHSPSHHHLSDIPHSLFDIATQNDWQNPLLFSLAPLAFFHTTQRRRTLFLSCYLLYLFLTWWIFTHRIDRFWVPLIPVAALLAGIGGTWPFRNGSNGRSSEYREFNTLWGGFVVLTTGAVGIFLLAFISSGLCGYNAFFTDLDQTAIATARITSPEIVELNERLPLEGFSAGAKVLFVGDAEIFDARFPLFYNTVFDKSLFEEWCGSMDANFTSATRPLKPAAEIRRTFAEKGITHVYVNWLEILRYRTTYGYTDFVTPGKFAELQKLGILGPAWNSQTGFQAWEEVNPNYLEEISRWGPSLRRRYPDGDRFKAFEVFPVLK